MIQSKHNEQIVKIGNWVTSKIDKYETILTFIFLIVLLLQIFSDLSVRVLMVLTLTTLSTLYFLKAYSNSYGNNTDGLARFIDKLASLGLSICVIGILFKLSNWPGYDTMLVVSIITLLIILPIFLVQQSKRPDIKIFTKRQKLRIFLIATIGLLLYLTPVDELSRIGILKNNNIEQTE